MALVDPENAPLACVPSEYPPLPSQKIRCFARGTAVVGTAGYGFVSVDPKAIVAQNQPAVIYSAVPGTFAGDTFAVSGTAGTATSTVSTPYALVSFGAGNTLIRYRLVGCALKAYYSNTEMNLSGLLIGVRHPDNAALAGLTNAQVTAIPGVKLVAIDSKRVPMHVHWIPTDPTDVEYSGTVGTNLPSQGILFSGIASTSNWITWEVWGIFEAVGMSVMSRTMSHADPEGFSAVLTAAQSMGDTAYSGLRHTAAALVNAATSELWRMSGHLARGLGGMALNGAIRGIRGGYGGPMQISGNAIPVPDRTTHLPTKDPKDPKDPTQPTPPHTQPVPPNHHGHVVHQPYIKGGPNDIDTTSAPEGDDHPTQPVIPRYANSDHDPTRARNGDLSDVIAIIREYMTGEPDGIANRAGMHT
jgi:hypothetical protein